MAIVSINPNPDYVGQIGFVPRRMKMVTTDNLATILTPGYMHAGNSQGFVVNPTDIFDVVYSYNTKTGLGTIDVFYVSINNGVITLSPAVFSGNLFSPIVTPDVNVNMITFTSVATAAQLAGGGLVPLIVSSGTKQYKFITLYIADSVLSVSFSGGGGNRNLAIGDTVTSFSVIPAANLQAASVDAGWGSTALPFPASLNGVDSPTAPGLNVNLAYTGGTTDYTTGSIRIYGFAMRIA